MRFPELILRALTLLALAWPSAATANAEKTRAEVAAYLRDRHPSISAADLATGSAAFDPTRRAEAESRKPVPGAADAVEAGRGIWVRKFANGRSLASCFPNGGRRIAASYPQYDTRVKRLVTLETVINQCLKTHGQPLLDAGDPATMGVVLAYLRSLSDGQKVSVRVNSPQAEQRFEDGRRSYFTRMGQQNYSCASCHLQHSGNFFVDTALPAPTGAALHWPYLRDGQPQSLQMRVRECLERMGAAPFPAGSDELAQIEYFLSYLANGMAIRPNAWRPR